MKINKMEDINLTIPAMKIPHLFEKKFNLF